MSPTAAPQILVIDDNHINLKLVSTVLRADGYEVSTTADAESALELIGRCPPRLVFTDVQLPEMDGLELTRRLKAAPKTRDIVVVALTAFAMEADRQAALAAGCDGFIARLSENTERARFWSSAGVPRNRSRVSDCLPLSGGVGDPVAVELEEVVGGCHESPL